MRSASRCALFLLGLLPLAAVGCSRAAAQGERPQLPPPLIKVKAVEVRPISRQIHVVGGVLPSDTSVVASASEGVINEYTAEEGRFVSKGTVLSVLKMETTDLGIAEAEALLRERAAALAELEAGYRQEDRDEAHSLKQAAQAVKDSTAARRARVERLFLQKATNQDDLDDAREKADAAAQAYLAAEARWKRLEAGPRPEEIAQARARHEAQREQVAFLKAEKEKRFTKAPFDGFIAQEHAYIGMWLSKGDPVVTLTNLSTVDVTVQIEQQDIGEIQVGDAVSLSALGRGTEQWPGVVHAIVPRSNWESGSRGFPVKVRVTNQLVPEGDTVVPALKEGMMLHARFTCRPKTALLVHKDAVVRSVAGSVVYVFDADPKRAGLGKVRAVRIVEGDSDQDWVAVTAEGLESGTPVVVEGAERLGPTAATGGDVRLAGESR